MPAISMPGARCRLALTNRLKDPTSGFNTYLLNVAQQSNFHPFSIDFVDDSKTFLEGKYAIEDLIQDDEVELPLITIFQGPTRTEPVQSRVITAMFSGVVIFGLDIHLVSAEGQSQTEFDRVVTGAHDALVNTLNDTVHGPSSWASQRVLWNRDIMMGQPTRTINTDTDLYLSTLSFALNFRIVS